VAKTPQKRTGSSKSKEIQKGELNYVIADSSGIVATRHDPSLAEIDAAGGDAGPGTTFVDNGGVILTNVNLQLIFWGSAWSRAPTPSDTQIENAVINILNGTYMSALSQYRGIGTGRYRGKVLITSSKSIHRSECGKSGD
jgi:hypothetical protein